MRKMIVLALCAAFPLATSVAYAQSAAPQAKRRASRSEE